MKVVGSALTFHAFATLRSRSSRIGKLTGSFSTKLRTRTSTSATEMVTHAQLSGIGAGDQTVERRQFLAAGLAPGRKEVNHDDLAALVRKRDGLPVQIVQAEGGLCGVQSRKFCRRSVARLCRFATNRAKRARSGLNQASKRIECAPRPAGAAVWNTEPI